MENKDMKMGATINEKDNLNLTDINILAVPHDIIFPDELNQFLKGQLQFVMHTNGLLQEKVSKKDTELKQNAIQISQLNSKISEYEQLTKPLDVQTSGNPVHLMSAKIIELSKKLKDKTVENETLKTKFSKMQQKLINAQNCPTKSESENTITNVLESEKSEDKTDFIDEIKMLNEKLSQTNIKLFEMKNSNTQLKNDLKTANKVLQQELGDNFTSIQQISHNNSNWRGRAQQIIGLQQKNAELQEKISTLSEKESVTTIPKVDPRKQMIEQLQKEITCVKSELEDTKKKLNGSRARVKVLENECNSTRSKLTSVETKSQNDEKLINLLKNQISSMEECNNSMRKEKNLGISKTEGELKKVQQEWSKQNTVIDNLKGIIDEKEKKIKELLEELQHAKTLHPYRPMRQDSPKELNKLKILEVEVNRLLELTAVLNMRLQEECNNHCLTQMHYKRERQRAAKIELKLSRLELENSFNNKPQSYSAKSLSKLNCNEEETISVKNIEKLKNDLELAEENISILKTRLKILQKEKELDYQKFASILSETSTMLLKYNIPQQCE